MSLWLVRAGRHGERESLALEQNVAVIGWHLPDLSGIGNRDELAKFLRTSYPEEKEKTLQNWESQIWPFIHGMNIGDLVALPLKSRPIIAIGEVTGPYTFRGELPDGSRNTRPVKWLKEIPRSEIDQDLLFSFGAFMTVCRISRNDAEARIRAMLGGNKPPTPSIVPGDGEVVPDIEEYTLNQIRDYISKKFRGHDLVTLVAAILKSQGYQLRVSPEGVDGGVDILAGKGMLGFDQPRLAVQVKSSDSPVDVKVLRELQGVLKNFGAEQGLLVSWGGYKSSVHKEAARLHFEIRLWDSSDVVELIQNHYTSFDDELQSELPLKRIWSLVPSED